VDDPNILKLKHSSGFCGALFGMPFFLAGIVCIVSPWIPDLNWEGGEPPPLYFIIPFGSIFAFVGGAIIFGRAGINIDARRKTVTTWWGFLVPFKSKTQSIPRDVVVALHKVRKRSDDSSYWSYDVKLEGDLETVDIEENRDWFKSRSRAEQVAKVLGADVVDRSQGEEIVTAFADLDKPLSWKIRESGEALQLPSPPPVYRTRVEMKRERVRFEIPPPGFSPLHVVQFIGLLVLYFTMSFVFRNFLEGLDWREDWVFFAFCSLFYLLPGLGLVISVLRDFTFSSVVEADPNSLTVVWKRFILTQRKTVSMSEIEDVTAITGEDENNFGKSLPYKRFIRVVSDKEELRFGQGMSLEELEWIHDILRYLIAKGS